MQYKYKCFILENEVIKINLGIQYVTNVLVNKACKAFTTCV